MSVLWLSFWGGLAGFVFFLLFLFFFFLRKEGDGEGVINVYIYIRCNLAPLGHRSSSITLTGNDWQVLHCEGTCTHTHTRRGYNVTAEILPESFYQHNVPVDVGFWYRKNMSPYFVFLAREQTAPSRRFFCHSILLFYLFTHPTWVQTSTSRANRSGQPATSAGVYMWMCLIRALYVTDLHLLKCLYYFFFLFKLFHLNLGWLYAEKQLPQSPSLLLFLLPCCGRLCSRSAPPPPPSTAAMSQTPNVKEAPSPPVSSCGSTAGGRPWNQKCEIEEIKVAYTGPVLLSTILNCIGSFCFIICNVALYRLLHNKSFFPDL